MAKPPLTPQHIDDDLYSAQYIIPHIGKTMTHTGNGKQYVIIGYAWIGTSDRWGLPAPRGRRRRRHHLPPVPRTLQSPRQWLAPLYRGVVVMVRLVTITCDFCGKVRDASKGEMTLLTCTIEGKGGAVCDGHEVDACMTCKRKLIDIFNRVGDHKDSYPFGNTDVPLAELGLQEAPADRMAELS